ncbi:MAG: aromatic amino acid lyase, partial [Acidimicrobiia bacterium]
MIAQYVQAALVAENKVLAHPASVDSITTSGNQEDHVSMGWGAGRKLVPILDNTSRVIAAEILCGVQGIDFRKPLEPGPGTASVVTLVRNHVPPLGQDRPLSDEIETVAKLIKDGSIEAAAG